MDLLVVIGTIAGILSMTAFFTQVAKTWKTKSTHDFSLSTFALISSSTFLWLMYSLFSQDSILTFYTSIMLILYTTMLIFKLFLK